MTLAYNNLAQNLCNVCQLFGTRQWCLATTGNYSVRAEHEQMLITQSGVDKSRLSVSDLMLCDLAGNPVDTALIPSAETALHAMLYQRDPQIGAVLHTHSVANTVVSMVAGPSIRFQGYEMQKALSGVTTHEAVVELVVLDNTQDMAALALAADKQLNAVSNKTPGFLVRGHGLYAWGSDIADAQRHAEALEFLLECVGVQ